ncbi:hypothetical protein BASA62_002831 [Batrachochytrium salamandrivorans]|nr:hypothetical protein BASA62_002831 [Batrachochytrium salamandrivorans]
MQFFYLLSFVVVASYAAALPQPAGLSEQYSNSVDINLASILKARSYQPVLDTREDSATSMLLERRADSDGASGGKNSFGIPPLSDLSHDEAGKLIDSLFKKDAFSFENIASTIENVGDGIAELSENGEKVKTKIVGSAGDLLALYLRKATYVIVSLTVSAGSGLNATVSFIESITTPAELSKVFLAFIGTFTESMSKAATKEAESNNSIVNILKDTGTVLWDVEDAIESLLRSR